MQIRVFGCEISISFPLAAALTIFFILDRSGSTVICCLSALCHELGHLGMMALFQTKADKIKLGLFDVNISDNGKYQRSLWAEICVLLAGAAANLLAAGIGCVLFIFYKEPFLSAFISSNLFLAFFNLLPVEALDGGNIIYLLLLRRIRHAYAVKILEILSFAVLLPLACGGFYVLLSSRYNFTLLLTSCYLMAIILLKRTKFSKL